MNIDLILTSSLCLILFVLHRASWNRAHIFVLTQQDPNGYEIANFTWKALKFWRQGKVDLGCSYYFYCCSLMIYFNSHYLKKNCHLLLFPTMIVFLLYGISVMRR